jgi:ABC-type uncharacterized transport system permease subunit
MTETQKTQTYTVVHFNAVTGYWHVEEDTAARGTVWLTDQSTAEALAAGYGVQGYQAEAVLASEVVAGLAPVSRSLIDTAR